MTTQTTPDRALVLDGHPDPGFGATLRSEWYKLRTSRSPRRNIVLGTVLGVGLSVILSLAIAASFDDWSASEQADFDPLLYPLSGALLSLPFFVAACVSIVTAEYSSGMTRLTLTTTPRRSRVLLAKAAVVSAVVTVAATVSFIGMIGLSQLVYATGDLPTASLSDGDFVRLLVLMAMTTPLFPVIAVTMGVLLRSAAPAVAIVLALIFAPSMFGGLLPDWWQRNIVSLLPGPAADSVAMSHISDSEMFLHPVAGALVAIGWAGVMMLAALRSFNKRDA